jgi:NADH:ubiquinone oxidoreductase subunit 6 (chain J)
MDALLFLIFAFIAVASAISLVVQTHPISSALSLIGVMGALAVLYLLLGGEFIAAAQLIVYAGAIMVLFVFVIMLLNAGAETHTSGKSRLVKFFGIPLFAIFIGLMGLHRAGRAARLQRRHLRRLHPGRTQGDRHEPLHAVPASL